MLDAPKRSGPGSVLTRTFNAGALLIFRVESGGDRSVREDALGPHAKPGRRDGKHVRSMHGLCQERWCVAES